MFAFVQKYISKIKEEKFNYPRYATWDDWDRIHKETKAKFPVSYYFVESIPRWYRKNIYRRLVDTKLWIYYRFIPGHQYHIIKPKIKPAYYPPDDRDWETK